MGAVKEVARPAESGKTEAKSSSAKRSSDETRGQEISSTLQLTLLLPLIPTPYTPSAALLKHAQVIGGIISSLNINN